MLNCIFNKRNLFLLWLEDAFIVAAASFASVSVLSAFFLEHGLNEGQSSFYFAMVSMVNLLVSSLFSGIAGKENDVIRKTALFLIFSGIATMLFPIFCFCKASIPTFYIGMLIIGAVLSAVSAVRVIYSYRIPCEVIDMNQFTVYQSVSGILCGISGILSGILVTVLYNSSIAFDVATACILFASMLCLFLASVCCRLLKKIRPIQKEEKTAQTNMLYTLKMVISDKDFLAMLMPNFIRGISAGIVAILPVLASHHFDMSASELSLINVLTYVATLLGCLLYAYLSPKFGTPQCALIGGIICCPFVAVFFGDTVLFYILYTIFYIGFNIMNYTVPEIIFLTTKPTNLSAIQTWRMILTTLGTTFSSAIFGMLIGKIPEWSIAFAGITSVLICVISYYVHYRGRLQIPAENK